MAIATPLTVENSTPAVQTQITTNTLLGNLINKCCVTRQPVNIPEFGTLNKFFGILANESKGIKQGGDFVLKYFMVGSRGNHFVTTNEDGTVELGPNQHQPIDGNLFTPMPFIARPIDSPLTEAERANYRMRTVEEFNGVSYEFWWMSLINFANYNPAMLKILRDPTTGNETSTAFIPDSTVLNPTPINLTSEDTVPVSNTYVNATATLDCSLDANALAELRNVAQIRFNNPGRAKISEMAVCYGIDTISEGNIGAGVMTYTEVLSAVAAHFLTESDSRNANNDETMTYEIDHGVSEPMLLHTVA